MATSVNISHMTCVTYVIGLVVNYWLQLEGFCLMDDDDLFGYQYIHINVMSACATYICNYAVKVKLIT